MLFNGNKLSRSTPVRIMNLVQRQSELFRVSCMRLREMAETSVILVIGSVEIVELQANGIGSRCFEAINDSHN